MSQNLKALAKKLLTLVKAKKETLRKELKKASRKLILGLSEIAFNIREGSVKAAKKLQNSKVIKTLTDKKAALKLKQKILRTSTAVAVVKTALSIVAVVLVNLANNGSQNGSST